MPSKDPDSAAARFSPRVRRMLRSGMVVMPVLLAALFMFSMRSAKATWIGFCTDCGCEDTESTNTQAYIMAEAGLTRSRFAPEFDAFENWLVADLFLTKDGPVCISAGTTDPMLPPGPDSLPASCPPPGGTAFPLNDVADDPGSPPSDPLAGATGPSAGSPPGNADTPMAWGKKWLLPWWMNMAQQITTVAEWQTMVFGTFLDAKQQVETQRLMRELAARAHKDYQPSFDICSYGTMIASLAASERRGETNGFLASRFGQVRSTGSQDNTATEGQKSDRLDRLTQFRQRFCDQYDNQKGMSLICKGTGSPPTAPNQWVDRDIDYAGVMERGLTLDLDFVTDTSDAAKTDDEQDLMALASNLYGGEVLYRLHEHVFHTELHKQLILDLRSIMAERSVAEASFYTIAGMKSPGTPAGGAAGTTDSTKTVKYMNIILQDLGFTAADIAVNVSPDVLGKQPSYYAQMELFTKKLYQDPAFYTNLYDTPANVERKKVTLQAIGLMQDFDTLQSYLRTEMLLSQILELELIKMQRTVQDHINSIGQSEKGG